MKSSSCSYYIISACPSHLLSFKVKWNDRLAHISKNKTLDCHITMEAVEINNCFTIFYKNVYSTDNPDAAANEDFLSCIDLPKFIRDISEQ